jgi:methylthioribose-1-phosphate isomerase
MLTREGTYHLGMTRGHELAVSRKGGGFAFDGWFRIAPPAVPAYNPSFDVAPARYITAIITERGVATPDYVTSLAEACAGSGAIHEL